MAKADHKTGLAKPELSPDELTLWRDGYRQHLVQHGLSDAEAAELAKKVAYRHDLYPLVGEAPDLFAVSAPLPATSLRKPRVVDQTAKLLNAGVEIASTPPDGFGDFMTFTHTVLCQVGLPRSKVEGQEFMRQSGTAWINIQSGRLDEGNGPVLQPIPYGVMPRLALAWVSTFAMRNNTNVIPIGDSAAEFLRLMGMDDQGARYTTLRRQMHALAVCRLQMGYKGQNYPNVAPIHQFTAWVANKDDQRALWPGTMTLTDNYFTALREYAVPLDNRALLALKGSALALDVYAWLAHRLHRIHGRGQILYWANLREQFAQEYKGKDPDKDFKKEFLPTLKKVLAVYPQAKVKPVTGGVLLLGSPPPIPYKGGPTV